MQIPSIPVPFSVSNCANAHVLYDNNVDCCIGAFLLCIQVSITWVMILNSFTINCSVFLTTDFFDWIPSYLFTHVVVILIGLWASRDRNSFEPIIAYIIAIAISILNDIILLGLYFSDAQDRADRK